MFKAILTTIAITAPLAALATSYAEYRLQYNLWDWLKDKINALRGRAVAEAQLTIKVARADLARVEGVLVGLPAHVRDAIRRRV